MPPGRQPETTEVRTPAASASPTRAPRGHAEPPVRRALRRESRETQKRILDAAEVLFIETGFAATSFRAIARRAGVNLAAAHYHFGSKEGLFGATLHRRVAPLNSARVAALESLESNPEPPSVREIMLGYLGPLADVEPTSPLPRLIARLYGEPQSIQQPLVQKEFAGTAERFLQLLGRALPEIPPDVLTWRFHFVIGAMIHLLAKERPPILFDATQNPERGLDRLLEFAIQGLATPVSSDTQPVALDEEDPP